MNNFFYALIEPIRKSKALFITLCILSVCMTVLGVVSAINYDGGVLSVDLGNIAYISYLKEDCGFVYFIFASTLSLAVIWLVIWLCCCKKLSATIGILFYLYFVYSSTVIFTTIILLYGLFSTLVLLLLLLIYLLIEFFFMMLLLCDLFSLADQTGYFKLSMQPKTSSLPVISLCLVIVNLIFCLVLSILKTFVILLVF